MALNSGKHSENLLLVWLLQLKVKQGLKCGSGHPAIAAGFWFFPSPVFFFFFSHFPSVTHIYSPSAFPVRHQHRLIPIPCTMLNPEILSPFLASWRCGMSRAAQGSLSLLWDNPSLFKPACRRDHPTHEMVAGPSTSPWSPLASPCGHSLLTRTGFL